MRYGSGSASRFRSRRARRGPRPHLRGHAAAHRYPSVLADRHRTSSASGLMPIPPTRSLQLAIVGRPNVGKSTLINRLIGDERLVTGPEAELPAMPSPSIEPPGRRLRLFRYRRPRRRARIDNKLEELAGADALRAIRFAQVVVIVTDATAGLEHQDLTIASLVVDEGRAPVLAPNKWDRVVANPRHAGCHREASGSIFTAGTRTSRRSRLGIERRRAGKPAVCGSAGLRHMEPVSSDTPAEPLACRDDGPAGAAFGAGQAGQNPLRVAKQDPAAQLRAVRQSS